MIDYSTWLTIDQFSSATGKGRRTIERLIERQQITSTKYKADENRKPITVIDPQEVAKHKGQVLRPVVQSATPTRQSDMLTVLKALDKLMVPVALRLSLSEKEGAQYLGVPVAEMRRLLNAGHIASFRLANRSRRIRRKDLEQFDFARHYQPATPLRHLAESTRRIEANGHIN